MKRAIYFGITLLLFMVQSVVFARLPILGVTIPLIFIFGLTVSIYEDRWEALFIGLFTGFLIDIYMPSLFGLNMLLNMWVFVICNRLALFLRRENKLLMSFFMALMALLRFLSEYIIVRLLSSNILLPNVGIVSLITLIVSFFMIGFYRRINKSKYFRKHIN